MQTSQAHPRVIQGVRRRDLLKAGLAAGITLSAWPPHRSHFPWAGEAGPPKHGGILRVRGYDPPHFDHHLTINFKTNTTLSFVYSKLVRHRVGPEIQPGTFIIESDLAERWEALDDTTYVFHLRRGVKWHHKPPLNGRELVAEDVKFTYDRFLTEKGNADRYMLEAVDRIEVVDRYRVKFLLKEPFAWLIDVLATPRSMWVIAPEVVQQFGDLKRPEAVIGTGPFTLVRYEPNVKAVFKRNPEYFRQAQPYVDGVEWLVLEDDSTGLAMYRTGQLDCGPWHLWTVRQQDLEALKESRPHFGYRDFLADGVTVLYMRTDQPPFNDVRVRRAISHAIDRQALIEGLGFGGEPSPAVPRGLVEWSLPIDQLGAGAKYYQHDPQEARRLLAEAGFAQGLKTPLHATWGYGRDLLDGLQLIQQNLKNVGIEVELKLQEYGAYMATTFVGKFEGLACGPVGGSMEPNSLLYSMYAPDQPRNNGHVNDPTLAAMLKEARRTQNLEARKKRIFDIQRYTAERQYYVYATTWMYTGSWQPYVKHYTPNLGFDFGSRTAVLWLDR
jgi:peptide/nickel transport system substrate-binding protein